jgi:ATP phosphoribosyltransferase
VASAWETRLPGWVASPLLAGGARLRVATKYVAIAREFFANAFCEYVALTCVFIATI